MKRTLALLLTAVMLLALAACGQKTDDGSGTPAPAPDSGSSTQTPSDSQQPSNAEVTNVVYGFPGTAARLNFVNDDGTYDGYEIAIIQELDKRLEQYTFELYCAGEFSALTPGLDAGKFNMVGSNITWKQERADNYLYSDVSYYTSPYVIGAPQDNTAINSLEDLAGTHVLTITGTATAIFLEKYNEEHPDGQIILDYIDAGAQECISQVVTGRYDACIQNKADFAIAQEEHGYELRLIEIENSNEISLPDGYFLFAKDEAELQKAVDECLKEMKADGTLTELCLRYFTMDLVPQE
jgi:L-cystine transport system substrate-binding protein